MKISSLLLCLILLLSALPVFAEGGTSSLMTPELLWKLGRLGGTAVSADGQTVAFTVRNYQLKENKGSSDLFLLDLKTSRQRRVLKSWAGIGDLQFSTSQFGERLFFTGLKARDKKTKAQAWAMNPSDGSLLQITDLKEGCANLKVSPSGSHIALTQNVKLDKEVKDVYPDLPKADARIIDDLMFRHWDSWHDFKYTHLNIARLGPDGKAGSLTDLMKGLKVDCPVPPFGGSEQFAWSPDGKQIAYTMKAIKDSKKWAQSTNSDVYLSSIARPQERKNITQGMMGYDNNPSFSPSGKFLAFHSMEREGFESDRNRIMVRDMSTGVITEATKGLDQTTHGAHWTPDEQKILFVSEHRGTNQIFQVNRQGGGLKQLSQGRKNFSLRSILPSAKRLLVATSTMERPYELSILNVSKGEMRRVSHINDGVYKTLQLPKVEERWVASSDGKKIHSWVIYPPNFDSAKKWPMLTYCQGGPQGQIGQWFSYRWNFHLMAANGYVVVAPNRRGLPGFGRAWNDEISGDWAGQPMRDILSVTDNMMAEPYIDKDKVAAIGASYGGYTVYWLMGNHAQRFCSMIAHCGVFNLEAMYGGTEETFFVDWELGGPYWKSAAVQEDYNRISPHKFVKNWDVPLLVIHGEKDFRIPSTQGMDAFVTAKLKGIPSRFLYYPEEGHWVLGPQNGVLWHRVFFEWLDKHCRKAS